MTTAGATSIRDFTVTLDTEASGGDMLVLLLDREGQPTFPLACGAAQLLWILDDAEHFVGGYRTSLARNIIQCLADGWTFEILARELGCTVAQVAQLHQQAQEAAEKEARELAEVGA